MVTDGWMNGGPLLRFVLGPTNRALNGRLILFDHQSDTNCNSLSESAPFNLLPSLQANSDMGLFFAEASFRLH